MQILIQFNNRIEFVNFITEKLTSFYSILNETFELYGFNDRGEGFIISIDNDGSYFNCYSFKKEENNSFTSPLNNKQKQHMLQCANNIDYEGLYSGIPKLRELYAQSERLADLCNFIPN